MLSATKRTAFRGKHRGYSSRPAHKICPTPILMTPQCNVRHGCPEIETIYRGYQVLLLKLAD